MDDADKVTEQADFQMKANRYKSKRDEPNAEATGRCLFCEAPIIEPGRRWCDAKCRDDWEVENR